MSISTCPDSIVNREMQAMLTQSSCTLGAAVPTAVGAPTSPSQDPQ